ncbi:alanine racemase [Algoriphagus mannitolivorans]|uniref:alanine racemase n=1 Tax=Algoriphagus mannitolivorans TaxID=226504 RepID=UPI0004217764|nr:alanine racemase [Algoriphagus mannitolivorans]
MRPTSYLEISASAYRQNIAFIRSRIGPSPVISAVVKGNAYGHGIPQMVQVAEEAGIRHFSTFSSDEAFLVNRHSQFTSEIMIMGMLFLEELPQLITQEISFYVFDFERLEAAIETAKSLQKQAQIHIEVETGFHRTGFELEGLDRLVEILIREKKHLQLKGLCTHFAGAESAINHPRVRLQFERYETFKKAFAQHEITFERYHTACSAATLLFPEFHLDLVRIGIAGYGFWPTQETFHLLKPSLHESQYNPFRRVISWKSQIMSLKPVETGEYVGYGQSYQTLEKMLLAIVPVGYSHGYRRILSNQGEVLISGVICPVVGTVNMNAVAVDVSHLDKVQTGQEVVLIGTQGDKEITVASFAETTRQVNYEMLTCLPSEISRRIVD